MNPDVSSPGMAICPFPSEPAEYDQRPPPRPAAIFRPLKAVPSSAPRSGPFPPGFGTKDIFGPTAGCRGPEERYTPCKKRPRRLAGWAAGAQTAFSPEADRGRKENDA